VKDVSRTIKITAQDMKFIPAILDVQAGETVRFVVTNMGPSKHEFVIGEDTGGQAEAEGTEAHEDAGETNEIELGVGETKELIWAFNSAREVEFSCHQPGHYEAGMLGTIAVKS
ncbi:MAG: plastocyanin/azurin family copper-binding protein, partial [Gammaproteobacteria bacterium]